MNILLLGSTGMLGSEMLEYISLKTGEYPFSTIHQIPRAEMNRAIDTTRNTISKTILRSIIRKKVVNCGITHVVNCIALTDTKAIETIPEVRAHSFLLNAQFPGVLAEVCNELNLHLVHFSTDYVFSEYSDADICPITYYSDHKLMGELMVKNATDLYTIIRVSWIYGTHRNKSFIHKFLINCSQHMLKGEYEIEVVENQKSIPTSCDFVAKMTYEIMKSNLTGTFSISPRPEDASRTEFANEILHIISKWTDKFENIKIKSIINSDIEPKHTVLGKHDGANFMTNENYIAWQSDLWEYMGQHRDEFEKFINSLPLP